MSKRKVVSFLLLMLFASLALILCDVYATASVWTDKADYAPWETVTIYGGGFNPNTNIDLTITRPDLVVDTDSTMSDASGGFVYYYVLNGMEGTYTVTATDGTNSATTTFTEAVHVDFRQYANVWDLWINSILQGAKSTYYEGMSVPQRVILVDIASTTGNVHNLDLSHQATKGGIHAYDWLTAWNQGNVPPLTYTPCGDNIGPHATTAICQALHLKTGSYEIFVDVPDDSFISKDGSTQARINAYETTWGNRQIRICGNQPITSASFSAMYHDVADGGDTGDSYILYTLTWTSASDQILIEMAGHLAVSGDPAVNPIAWGVGLGSSQIGGGPYHFKLGTLDGHSLGSQDNQIMGADVILPSLGKVTIVKDAVPDDPEDFSYTGGFGSFILDDDADPTYSNTKVVTNVAVGSYNVVEGAETWWTLTSIGITGDDDYTSGNTGTRTATIYVDPGEDITITFTNTRAPPEKASIGDFVWKDLDGDGLQDVGEPGFQGVTVNLYIVLSPGTFLATTTTDLNGFFSFTNLDPGDYYLQFIPPPGYVFSPQDQGTDDAKDSDANSSTGQTAVTTLTSGEADTTWDAGVLVPPVGGVWVPTNKTVLLAPWIGLASLITVAAASIVYVKRTKKQHD